MRAMLITKVIKTVIVTTAAVDRECDDSQPIINNSVKHFSKD